MEFLLARGGGSCSALIALLTDFSMGEGVTVSVGIKGIGSSQTVRSVLVRPSDAFVLDPGGNAKGEFERAGGMMCGRIYRDADLEFGTLFTLTFSNS